MHALLLLALATPTPAHAGEILVEAPITTIVLLEGIAQDVEAAASVVVLRGLQGGSYQVEVQSAFGKTKAQQAITVGPDEAVRVRYQKRALVELSRGPMVAGGTPPGSLESDLARAADTLGQAAQNVANQVDQAARRAVEDLQQELAPAPAESPAGAPAESPAEAPAEAPAEDPAEAPADPPSPTEASPAEGSGASRGLDGADGGGAVGRAEDA